ncbi:MAG: DUF4838 domain-containing protein, partial [Promethearchaeota archaeon]
WLQQKPGTDVALLMGMCRVIVDEGLYDDTFVAERCENFDELKESLKGFNLDSVARITGIPKEQIAEAARTYATNSPAAIFYAMGITQHSHGTDNVIAVVCHMHPSCDSHPLESCELNQRYVKNLKGWLKISDQILVWHYITDFRHYLLPFPNFNAVINDIKFYHEVGVRGFLGQAGFLAVQEFDELRNYTILKMLWNKDIDLKVLFDEYFKNVYGSAGKYIQKYFDILQEKVKDSNIHMHLYSGLEVGYIDDTLINKANELFDQAEEIVKDNEIYSKRVRKARMSIDYAMLLQPLEFGMKFGKLAPIQLRQKLKILDRFKQAVKEFNVNEVGENLEMKIFLDYCDEIFRKHSFIGLLELAPMVLNIIDNVLERVKSELDDNNNVRSNKLISPILKLGLDPRTLLQWFENKNIADYNENNIWERKIIEENLNKWRSPKYPKVNLRGIPKSLLEEEPLG